MEAHCQTAHGRRHHDRREHHHNHTNDTQHPSLSTRQRVHRPQPTGHALTSPRHYAHFAAIGTTYA